jgi:hypothetical protein
MKVFGFIVLFGIAAGQTTTISSNSSEPAAATTTTQTDAPSTTAKVTEATVTETTAAEAEIPATMTPTTTKSTTTTPKATSVTPIKCGEGFWGPNCHYLCSSGCVGNKCNQETGKCTEGCKQTKRKDAKADVHTHELGDDETCSEARCDEIGGCGPEGICVDHNKCVCPKLYTAVKGVHHGNETYYVCKSLRLDGIKGGAAALIVMIIAISFCAGVQTYCSKTKTRSYSYVD